MKLSGREIAMDARAIGIVLLTALTIGCGKPITEESVFPKPNEACADEAVPNRHLARWHDGHISVVEGSSREEVLKNFVRPNLAQLDLIEPDYRVRLIGARPMASAPGPSPDNWGQVRINAQTAWQQGYKGQGVVVAVIDSGTDRTHTQLRKQIYQNPGETGLDSQGQDRATNKIDDDRNGYIDDAAGFDFAHNSGNVVDNEPHGHGTHVAGVIAAYHTDTQAGPASYVQGVAPQAKILPLAFIDENGWGQIGDAIRAIDYAVAQGARLINASWGGGACSTLLRDKISELDEKAVIFVAASGNDGLNIDFNPVYPAAFDLPAQFTVGATGQFDYRASFSNYGVQHVHIFAPGIGIISTIPGNTTASLEGTSMATPFVTGALASLLSLRPHASIGDLRQALYMSALVKVQYENASHGRLDLGSAVSALIQLEP